MKKSHNSLDDVEILRLKAEEQLKEQQSKISSLSSENDLRKLAYELQVHQIELEMQYEHLKQSKEEAYAATQKYTQLYDFAPSGYFTLTILGEIIELNLLGANLLGKERLHLINRRFGSSVSDQTKPIFNNFLDRVFKGNSNESCEVTLSVENKNLPTYVYLTGHTFGNDERCHISVLDITERKNMEEERAQKNNALLKLNRFALELSNLSSDDNLEVFITKQIKEFTCAEVSIFSEYDSSTRTTATKQIEMEPGLLEKVVGLLGKQVKDIHSVVSDENYQEMTTQMVGIRKTLYEASFGSIPRLVGASIQALLKVDRIIGVAYIFEKKLFGTSLLLMGKGQPDPPKEILENFIQLAAVSLRRKKAEQNLIASEEKFKALYQFSNDAIMLLDRNGFFDCNPQTLKLFKINSKEEFIKLSPIELSPPVQSDGRNALEALEENINIAYRDGYNRFDWIHQKLDGEIFYADVLLSAFDYSGKRVLQATVRDITERKIAEEAIENSDKQNRLLFDEMLSGFAVHEIICDQSGKPTDYRFLSVNKSFEKMTGLDASDILGKTILEVLPETEYSWIELYGKVALTREPIHFENYDFALGKYYEVRAYCPEYGKFATLINDISKRKNAEDSLSESHQFNLQIINNALEGIIVYDHNLKCQVWNPFMENLTSLPASEAIGKHPLDLFPFLKDTGVIGILEKALNGKKNNEVVFPFTVTATGRKGWASDKAAPFYNTKNEIIGVISTVRDITEYKLAEQELLGKDALLNLTGYTAQVGGWEIDTETMNQKWTDENYKIHEVDLTFNPNVSNGINFYVPSSRTVIEKAIQQAIEFGKPFDLELEFITNKGNYRWVHSIGKVKQVNGKTEKVYGSIQDITVRKKTEEELIIKNLIFESSIAANSISDKEGNITHCNSAFLKIWGFDSKDEVIGKPIQFFIKNEDEALKIITSLNELGFWEGEFTGLKKDSTTFIAYSLATNVQNNKKENIGYYSAVVDITKRKHSELELINAKEKAEESDRLKTAFLTNMSHEIRTPMNGIIGFTDLLKEPNLSSDDQQDIIQTIQISGARMLNTINSIVDMSKIESGLINIDIKETNLNEKIEFTYKFFKPEVENKGLQFFFKNSLTAKDAFIKTDNEKVYGILTNLVRNAIKFTYEGSIEFGCVLKSNSEPAELEFFVKDTGIGIPQKQHQLIFERFRQGSESNNRGYEGSGLGLSISKSYVEMLGGRIWLESEEGKGSTFYFTIPYNPVSEEIHKIENVVFTDNKEVQTNKLKILIVEDDEISYSLLSRVVQKISKEVLHAITGLQAVEACRNNPDLDLVLMDIRMPRMNGLEATQQIRQFNKDVIIIAQTAYGFSGDREKAIEAGCNDYITKPINMTLLFELIKKYFN